MAGNPKTRQFSQKASNIDGVRDLDKVTTPDIKQQSGVARFRTGNTTAIRSQALFGDQTSENRLSEGKCKRIGLRTVRCSNTSSLNEEKEAGTTAEASEANPRLRFTVQPSGDADALTIPDNVLLPYINLQYHFVWSLVPAPVVPKVQTNIPVGATSPETGTFSGLRRAILAEGSVPFASTGDVFRFERAPDEFDPSSTDPRLITPDPTKLFEQQWSPKKGRHYYNIESLTLNNVMAPTPQNPYINSMITGKMTVVEPHGFKWNEDARKVANDNGYVGLSLGRVVWRLDIFFSGYNQDTGEWMPFIPMDTRTRKTKLLTYYMNITTVEAKVTHTGTVYDMSIVPSGHSAYRPEEMNIDAGAIFTGGETQTFGGFLERVSQAMNKSVSERTGDQVKRKYEFKAPSALLSAPFYSGKFESKKGFLKGDPDGGSVVSAGRDMDVLTLLDDALKDLELTWINILKKDDPRHLKPRVLWGIRFNVVYGSGVNPGTNDFDTISNQYIIEPFVTFKGATMNNRAEMEQVTNVDSQARRVKEMIRLGMVNRIYNYINTSENNEVLEVDIALKNFYYHTMFTESQASSSAGTGQATGGGTTATNFTKKNDEIEKAGTLSDDQGKLVPSNQENSVQSSLRRLFGSSIDNPSATCDARTFKTPADVYGGGFGEMPKSDATGSVGGESQLMRTEAIANINDHIKNDMITIDIEVRGDPIWLLTPYGKDSGNILTIGDQAADNNSTNALVQTQGARCFFLRMFTSEQIDYMNPDRETASSSCSILGGFYEAITVQSKFEGGKFTQTIHAVKMIHLNYIENNIGLASNAEVVGGDISTDSGAPLTNSLPPDTPTPIIDDFYLVSP